jgi:hypothetical protein
MEKNQQALLALLQRGHRRRDLINVHISDNYVVNQYQKRKVSDEPFTRQVSTIAGIFRQVIKAYFFSIFFNANAKYLIIYSMFLKLLIVINSYRKTTPLLLPTHL